MALISFRSDATVEDAASFGDETLRDALSRLNPRYERALALRYLAGLDTTEAAAAMGLANPVFSVVLSRATKALARELGRLEGERR